MEHFGPQYPNDDKTDQTGFLKRARLHQSKFRAKTLGLPYDTYGNYLTAEDGAKGMNFFNGLGVFNEVKKRFKKYSKPLYANMLRSEHIPFNFFAPFKQNAESQLFCRNVLNDFFKDTIQSVDRIEIEYAPSPAENYLKDKTSFDAYIEYTHTDGMRGIIGIEVKYTEKDYKIGTTSTQATGLNDGTSKYFVISDSCELYTADAKKSLIKDRFRQVWRNHLLGESILLTDSNEFKHFTSLTLFPQDNSHFIHTSKEYIELLASNERKFLPVTYEEFFASCSKHCPDSTFKKWIEYLTSRYLVADC